MKQRTDSGRLQLILKKLWKITMREIQALFFGFSILAGALAFCAIIEETWDLPWHTLRWIALSVAVMNLPKVFNELRGSKAPYSVRFAQAFRHGFLGLNSAIPNLSKWLGKVRELWRNLR